MPRRLSLEEELDPWLHTLTRRGLARDAHGLVFCNRRTRCFLRPESRPGGGLRGAGLPGAPPRLSRPRTLQSIIALCEEKMLFTSSCRLCRSLSAIGRRVLSIESFGAFQGKQVHVCLHMHTEMAMHTRTRSHTCVCTNRSPDQTRRSTPLQTPTHVHMYAHRSQVPHRTPHVRTHLLTVTETYMEVQSHARPLLHKHAHLCTDTALPNVYRPLGKHARRLTQTLTITLNHRVHTLQTPVPLGVQTQVVLRSEPIRSLTSVLVCEWSVPGHGDISHTLRGLHAGSPRGVQQTRSSPLWKLFCSIWDLPGSRGTLAPSRVTF